MAIAILFLLLTIFLRMGWMNKDHLGEIVTKSLKKKGVGISAADAAAIGKDLRKPMWSYHVLTGYVLIGLYLIRMAITWYQGISFANPFSKLASAKDKFKSWAYIVFYALLLISLFTGFMIVNGPHNLKAPMEFIHVKSLYYVVLFIIIHVVGVFLADRGTDKGIISKIISGDKK